MKTPAVGRSACWLCAVLDVLSALALSPAPSRPHLAQLWTKLIPRTPRGWRMGGERTRHGRSVPQDASLPYIALDHGTSPMSQDARDTEVLHFINNSMNARPDSCSPQHRNIMLDYDFHSHHFQQPFQEQVKKAVQIANVLNNLFLYNREPQDLYNNVTYFALTQSIVQGDLKVKGCGIAFQLGQYRPVPPNSRAYFFPYSYRADNGATVVSDLTSYYEPFNTSWFFNQSSRDPNLFSKAAETIFTNASDVGTFYRYESRWNKTVRVSASDGFWADPYYDCLLEAWILQFSVPFFEMVDGTTVFKGVVLLDLDFSALEINQCDDDVRKGALFANTHRCRGESTRCVHISGQGLRWGSYECQCKSEFYFPDRNATNRSFRGRDIELAYLDMIRNRSFNYTQDFMCLPCRKGCDTCEGDEPCIVEFNVLLRGIPLGIQSYCMTIALVVAFVIARLRKTKVMRSSVWVLLEMMVLGAVLLYATVVIQYFEPTAINCLLLPWFREMGFAILYGTLLLKIYRILAEFQSRKAHRVHVRDKDLFKALAVMLVVVLAYMGAWTAVNVDHLTTSPSLLLHTATTPDNLTYVLCKSLWWDYAIEVVEVLFLAVGGYLSYCVRSAPSDYNEGRYVTIAILYELVLSLAFYVLKHVWWLDLHPDHLFLMYFCRCQATVSVNLVILLGPKLWYAFRPPDDDRLRTRAYSQSDVGDSTAPETMKLNVGISSNGDVDVGDISLNEMDPEDIRAELKRLYTQLQIYKTKTMRKDNPHISKRRGGRKQTHRRFSLQAFHHKHRHHHEQETEHEMSKTPEESTNSAEAMTFAMEPSVKEDPNEGGGGRNPPSVSFRPGHT